MGGTLYSFAQMSFCQDVLCEVVKKFAEATGIQARPAATLDHPSSK